MALLTFSRESSRPKTGAQLAVHFALSLALLLVSLGVAYLVVMSETRRSYRCNETSCMVTERNGLFASAERVASARKPVQFEARPRQLGGLAVLMIDASGEGEWITAVNETPTRVRQIAADLQALPDGQDYLIAESGFGIEWYIACVLLLTACVLNLRNSLRWYLDMR